MCHANLEWGSRDLDILLQVYHTTTQQVLGLPKSLSSKYIT